MTMISPENDVVSVDAPFYYASSIEVTSGGNDFLLTFSQARPAHAVRGGARAPVTRSEPIAAMALSPQTAKDLYLALEQILQQFEGSFGEIKTPYSRERAKGRV